MKIEWSQPARDDLAQIHAHIAADSPRYARQFSERIIGAVRKLHEFPLIGRKVPEADLDNVRELIFQNYRIIYHRRTPPVRLERDARQPRSDSTIQSALGNRVTIPGTCWYQIA